MTRILVTGANGFVGRHLCSTLLEDGHELRGHVRTNLHPLTGVDYIVSELHNTELLLSALSGIDCVVHLAARAHKLNDDSISPLDEFRAVNRDASLHLADLCLKAGVKRFIFVSSIGVNGAETFDTPFTELSKVAPHAPYAISKWEAEIGLKELLHGAPMELVIIRPTLVYSAQAPGNFRRLLKLVASGVPLPFGTVCNLRSIVSLENLNSFISLCVTHPKAAGELFLISDGDDLSLPDILRFLAEGMSRRPLLIPVPVALMSAVAGLAGRKGLINQLCGSLVVDCSKGRNLLGWKPLLSAKEALITAGHKYRDKPSAAQG